MSGKDHRDNTRVPVALRIKLRFRNLDTFISKFATNISSTGMFISSRKPRESGTQLRFELRLADDSTVISGKGRVVWVREYDPAHPKEPHGMGIEFVGLSRGSRELIEKIVEQRIHQGLGETENIPYALEDQAPRTELTQEAAPAASPESIDEPPKQARPAQASTGTVEISLDDLDSAQVDLRAVLRRARELVGKGSADGELDQLFRVSAAPIAETVDDASHKLAQMLGGNAVRGKRSRHRDPPTDHAALADLIEDEATPEPPAQDEPSSKQVEVDEPELSPLAVIEDDRPIWEDAAAGSYEESPVSQDDIATAVSTATLPASPEYERAISVDDEQLISEEETSAEPPLHAFDRAPSVTLETIEDDAGDFRDEEADQPTAVNSGLSAVVGLDDALSALDQADESLPEQSLPELDQTLASLEFDGPHEFALRAETDEAPIVISHESVDLPVDESVDVQMDESVDLPMDESVDLPMDESVDDLIETDESMELDMLEDEDADFSRSHSVTSVPSGIDVGVLDPGGLEENGIYELSKPGTGPIDLLKLANLPSARPLDDDDEHDAEIELDLPD